MQPITESNDKGEFSLEIPGYNSGTISASKVDEGFPDAVIALYGRSGYKSFQVIDPLTFNVESKIELQFKTPQRTLVWTVVGNDTGKPLANTRIDYQAYDNREITGSDAINGGKPFIFVLPRTPVRFRVAANGYADQLFVEHDVATAASEGFSVDRRTIVLAKLK